MKADRLIQPIKIWKVIMLLSQNQQVNKIPSSASTGIGEEGKKNPENLYLLTLVPKVSWFSAGENIKLGCYINTFL